MGKKYTYEEVKKYLANLGYELLDKEYKISNFKLTMKDKEGYYYYSTLGNLKTGFLPQRFHPYNPYTIQNIKLWCKINNKLFELISNEYINSRLILKWKCLKEDCGEIFEVNWSNISQNKGCSFCVGMKVGISNCLATLNQVLASEWHPILNGELTPYDVTISSGKEVWWQCSKNHKHEWHASPNSRTSHKHNTGCPYCFDKLGRKLPSEDYNLFIINPTLCEEWNYNKNYKFPSEYTPNSGEKVHWICKINKKHKWEAQIASRNNGVNCPYCSGKLPSEDYNLLIKNPELCEEWNYEKNNANPENFLPNSNKKAWWKCQKCSHEWEATINSRNNGVGCPECNMPKGEVRISEYFILNRLLFYIPQKEFDDLLGLGGGKLSYDFYLPKYNLLIEYQGKQHERYIKGFHKTKEDFEKQVEHDRRKKEYALENGYNFLEIWYKDFDNIEEIIEKKLNLLEEVMLMI